VRTSGCPSRKRKGGKKKSRADQNAASSTRWKKRPRGTWRSTGREEAWRGGGSQGSEKEMQGRALALPLETPRKKIGENDWGRAWDGPYWRNPTNPARRKTQLRGGGRRSAPLLLGPKRKGDGGQKGLKAQHFARLKKNATRSRSAGNKQIISLHPSKEKNSGGTMRVC